MSDSDFIRYPEIGVCGLSCLLCPMYNTDTPSRCEGCKSANRMAVGCPFITCAVKKKGIEFCWDCAKSESCERWRKHRDAGQERDSFKCYRTLESDIAFIRSSGVPAFVKAQRARARLLQRMLKDFNEGRSKSMYCIAATVLSTEDLNAALKAAAERSGDMDIKGKARLLRSLLDEAAERHGLSLKLRK